MSDERKAIVTDALRTRYWAWTHLSAETAPQTLLELLTRNLPHIPVDSWPERFDFGGVYVNGIEALTDRPLPFPCRVEYYEPKFEISAARSIFPEFDERFIIYHDHDVAVAWKPPRLSSMPAKEQRHFSLKASLERIFKKPIHMPSRLDVSAQGLVVVSLSPRAHRGLQQAFEGRRVTKTYLCASAHPCSWSQKTTNSPLGRDPLHPVLRMIDGINAQPAETHLTALGTSRSEDTDITVIRARPITGRTHQIRVHVASEGAPIFGDKFYGGAAATYLHLVSAAVGCAHPVTGTRLSVTLPASLRPSWVDQFALNFENSAE